MIYVLSAEDKKREVNPTSGRSPKFLSEGDPIGCQMKDLRWLLSCQGVVRRETTAAARRMIQEGRCWVQSSKRSRLGPPDFT